MHISHEEMTLLFEGSREKADEAREKLYSENSSLEHAEDLSFELGYQKALVDIVRLSDPKNRSVFTAPLEDLLGPPPTEERHVTHPDY